MNDTPCGCCARYFAERVMTSVSSGHGAGLLLCPNCYRSGCPGNNDGCTLAIMRRAGIGTERAS